MRGWSSTRLRLWLACGACTLLAAAAGAAEGSAAASSRRPVVSTGSASVTGPSTATVSGAVDPHGAATTYKFDYGTTSAYGASTPATDIGSGSTVEAASAALSDLEPNTTYHYRIEATNRSGTARGADATFTTAPALAPGVGSEPATSVADHTAVLQADVNPNGQGTTYQFQYGTTTAYGQAIPITPGWVGSGMGPVPVARAVSGLAAGTAYHYRIVASNQSGTSYGGDATFTTSQDTVTLQILTAGGWPGVVTSSPAGILCPSTCSASFPAGTVVTLTASAPAGSGFAGWSGPCSGTGSCTLAMSATTTVTATFGRMATPGCGPVRRSIWVLLRAPRTTGLTGAARRRALQQAQQVDRLLVGVRCRHAAQLEVWPTILVHGPHGSRRARRIRLRAIGASLRGDGALRLDARLPRGVTAALRSGRRVTLRLLLDATGQLSHEHETFTVRMWPKVPAGG